MKNIEFAEKHGKIYNVHSHKIERLNLQLYQRDILYNFQNYRFIAIQHSRQMGLTTMLLFHITNFLLQNTDEKKILCFKSPNINYSKEMINKIRNLLAEYCVNYPIDYIKNNQSSIKLNNGNEFRVITNIHSLNLNGHRGKEIDYPYALIVDNAAWVKDVDELVGDFTKIDIKQIILVSGKRLESNKFYDIFTNNGNLFHKQSIHWRMNPIFTDEWYEQIKKTFGGDSNQFLTEVDLIDVNTRVKNKDRIINVRLDDDVMNKLSIKLIEKDLSLSKYIRLLIKKDI